MNCIWFQSTNGLAKLKYKITSISINMFWIKNVKFCFTLNTQIYTCVTWILNYLNPTCIISSIRCIDVLNANITTWISSQLSFTRQNLTGNAFDDVGGNVQPISHNLLFFLSKLKGYGVKDKINKGGENISKIVPNLYKHDLSCLVMVWCTKWHTFYRRQNLLIIYLKIQNFLMPCFSSSFTRNIINDFPWLLMV